MGLVVWTVHGIGRIVFSSDMHNLVFVLPTGSGRLPARPGRGSYSGLPGACTSRRRRRRLACLPRAAAATCLSAPAMAPACLPVKAPACSKAMHK